MSEDKQGGEPTFGIIDETWRFWLDNPEVDVAQMLDGKSGYLVQTRKPLEDLAAGDECTVIPVTFPTTSERIRNEARARLAAKRYRRAAHRLAESLLYAAVMAGDETAIAVLKFHEIVDWSGGVACRVCIDEDDSAAWPCGTVQVIARVLGVDVAD